MKRSHYCYRPVCVEYTVANGLKYDNLVESPKRQTRGNPATQSYLSSNTLERGVVEVVMDGSIISIKPAFHF
jgi:hypothetical protein